MFARRYDKERCARMQQWAGGDDLTYPDLPFLPGIGRVPYHSVCNFTARAAHLWPPEDLRRWLQARHMNVRRLHRMDAYVDDATGEFIDGLVDLVVGIEGMPLDHQPQPLSQDAVDRYGHVDPTMWTTLDDSEQLTLEDNMQDIMRRVQHLYITDASIVDRFVLHKNDPLLFSLTDCVVRVQVCNSQRGPTSGDQVDL